MSKITLSRKHAPAFSLIALLVSSAAYAENTTEKTDVLLIGGGIMSASLGTVLQEIQPDWKQLMVEKLDGVALESSNGWNNAGTGHSANMELNYTPEREDGSIDVTKALEINEAFMISRQFWSSQVKRGVLNDPHSFINSTPHMSFVWGDKNVEYLTKRYQALQQTTLFQGMQFSTDQQQIKKWAPLIIEGRDPKQKVAATWTPVGTDVNYGEITRQLVGSLKKTSNFKLETSSEVTDFKRNADNSWHVTITDVNSGKEHAVDAKYVFIGAGGGALKLLQKPAFLKRITTQASRLAARSWCLRTRKSPASMAKKSMVRHPLARRRCPCRTLTPVSWMANAWCCSGHSRRSPLNS